MKRRIVSLLLLGAMTASLLLSGCGSTASSTSQSATGDADLATVQAMAQKALDQQEIQNIMSRHIMYHCYGQHQEEMEQIWVTEEENKATASFGNSGGFWAGYDSIWESYVTNHDSNWLSSAEQYCVDNGIYTQDEIDAMSEDELQELVDTYGGVGQLLLHVTTTGIIEVADDGLTAKCFWYSPGIVAETGTDANSIWEMYGVDFIKENGEWKIWHLHMFTDVMSKYGYLERQETASAMHMDGINITSDEYLIWAEDRTVDQMASVLIPTAYSSWSWDDDNFGPTREQWETLIDSEGWDDILGAWDKANK